VEPLLIPLIQQIWQHHEVLEGSDAPKFLLRCLLDPETIKPPRSISTGRPLAMAHLTMAQRKAKEKDALLFMSIHVNPVLEELVRNCVVERPEDVMAYSVKFFQIVEEELNYEHRNREVLLNSGSSRMVRNVGQTIKMVVLEGIGSQRSRRENAEEHFFHGSRYKAGDELKMNSGKVLYTVKRLLGSGSFGEVHVVHSHNEDILCAMKCTKLDNMTKRQRLSLFRPMCDEALIGTKIGDHANLVGLRFVQVNGAEFLVMMNFVKDACELQKAIATNSLWNNVNGGVKAWGFEPPREEITSTIALCWYQVCSALEHLHGLEIAHCDIKPENILVNVHNWHIWVFDLGLARQGQMSESTHGIVNIRYALFEFCRALIPPAQVFDVYCFLRFFCRDFLLSLKVRWVLACVRIS
jgi:hypothetical protein